jgi:uncharacterized membrane protein
MRILLLGLFVHICLFCSCNGNISSVDQERKLLYDNFRLFTKEEQDSLLGRIKQIESSTKNEIVVFVDDYLGEKDAYQRGKETFDSLRIGKASFNNGVLIFISPANQEIYLLVGYGLEWQISNLEAKEIIDVIIKCFSNQRYFEGVLLGINQVCDKTSSMSWDVKYQGLKKIVKSEGKKVGDIAIIESKSIKCNTDECQIIDGENIFQLNTTENMLPLIYMLPKSSKTVVRISNIEPLSFNLIGVVN